MSDSLDLGEARCEHGLRGSHHVAHYGCDGANCEQVCPGGDMRKTRIIRETGCAHGWYENGHWVGPDQHPAEWCHGVTRHVLLAVADAHRTEEER